MDPMQHPAPGSTSLWHAASAAIAATFAAYLFVHCVSATARDSCNEDNDCQPGAVCIYELCAQLCNVNGDCVFGEECQAGLCVSSGAGLAEGERCAADAECLDGNCECLDAACSARTCAVIDCVCGYGALSTCGGPLADDEPDPEDCGRCLGGDCQPTP
jgi:hypothetical protein